MHAGTAIRASREACVCGGPVVGMVWRSPLTSQTLSYYAADDPVISHILRFRPALVLDICFRSGQVEDYAAIDDPVDPGILSPHERISPHWRRPSRTWSAAVLTS